jgi:hypothetical protein
MKKIAILTIVLLVLVATSAQADLVALWHLDGDATDSSGNGNDGAVYGAGYVGGTFGQALSFDGNDDYVDIGTANLVTGAHTVEFWAYSSSEQAEAFLEFNLDSLGFISYKDEQERVMCGHRGGVQPYTAAGTFPLNQWNHIALVYNGGDKSDSASYKIYINGGDQVTILPWGPIGSSFEHNYIGRERNTYGNSTIDEVRIWDEALSADEIDDSYELGGVQSDATVVVLGEEQLPSGDWVIFTSSFYGLDGTCDPDDPDTLNIYMMSDGSATISGVSARSNPYTPKGTTGCWGNVGSTGGTSTTVDVGSNDCKSIHLSLDLDTGDSVGFNAQFLPYD